MATHAKEFELNELVIESITGEEWDISFVMGELNIYEDIFESTISADIVIDDATNLIKNIPITGHEWIRITFQTPDRAVNKLRLRIYKVSSRELEKERRQFFMLHCIAQEQFKNEQILVSKAYKGLRISEIAKDIQEEFLNSSFATLESTRNLFHIIPANWSPVFTINYLAKRAVSETYNGANYVYFQNIDGFKFCSLEYLCDQKPKIRYLFQPANVRDQAPTPGYKRRTVETDEVAVQSYKFVSNLNTLENLSFGMYENKLLWHDIMKKDFGEETFNYSETYDSFKHVEPNTVSGGSSRLLTSKSDISGTGVLNFASIGMPGQESHVKHWMQQRMSQLQQLQNICLHCTVPGDSSRRAGDIVEFWLPSPEPLVDNQQQMDSHYMGRFLVTSVRHSISKGQYGTILELVKDSVFESYR
jgi:hypothetical protein